MDNQVKTREWVKTAAIIFLAVLLVLTFFSNTILNASLKPVMGQTVQSGSIKARISGQGMVKADETYDVTVNQTRKVASVKINVGSKVEVGDVLFTAVCTARTQGVDPERARHRACEKFMRRFACVERLAAEQGTALEELSKPELERLYQTARKNLEGKEMRFLLDKP